MKTFSFLGCCAAAVMAKAQRQNSVTTALIIAEFDFEHLGCQLFYDGSHLAALKFVIGEVFHESDHRKKGDAQHLCRSRWRDEHPRCLAEECHE